ncbi:unnamed protein product [Blepharisma stoltei]|uniref:Small ribosomal subunit protein mS35 mitochondrial conserved domain-containing protein n=1 Tax=Blepharisma stoltei TaxID=1481888 RepID=A0AAU9IR69_9CILI|nr:unnamed protein product [Blepharisma stoltei]
MMMALRRFASGGKSPHELLPPWQKSIWRDPFDYPLRTIEQVKEEIKNNPPSQKVAAQVVHYYGKNATVPNRVDLPSQVVKMWVDMRNWNLTKLQKERLIFLLGTRYKNSPTFKVVCNHYATREENWQKCMDILHELFYECKRAP